MPNGGSTEIANNENYSDTDINVTDGSIINPGGINAGFVHFMIGHVFAPLPRNRRFACRLGDNAGNESGPIKGWAWNIGDHSGEGKHRMRDLTYGMLFKGQSEVKKDKGILAGAIDFGIKNITNVADIPIRRDVIHNLINKNNTKMSLAQLMQELMHPSAFAIDTADLHVQIRQTGSSTFEFFQASKDWRARGKKIDEEATRALFENRYPLDSFLIDYKSQDSLIQNIDMNSKFDPAIALTFQRGAEAFAGNPDAIVKFLSYGNVAADLKEFLADEDRLNNVEGNLYDNVITVGEGSSGDAAKIQIQREAFFDVEGVNGGKKLVSDSLMARFLSQQPERMRKLNAMLQSQPGSNFATQLLANYMRKCTITIHGTAGLTPFNTINIRGVLPYLEGEYWVTGVRESVTPQDFKTIIEGILIRPKNFKDAMQSTDDTPEPITPVS